MIEIHASDQQIAARSQFLRIGRRGGDRERGDPRRARARQIADSRIGEAVIDRIEMGQREGEHQSVGRADRAVELEAPRRLLARIRQSEAGAGEDVRLEAVQRLVEQRDVQREAGIIELDAEFVDFRFFRPGEARPGAQIRHRDARVADRRGRREDQAAARTGREVGGQRPAVPRQVDRARLEAGGVGEIRVDIVVHLVRDAAGIAPVVVFRLARFDRIRHAQEGRDELQRLKGEQRIDRRIERGIRDRSEGRSRGGIGRKAVDDRRGHRAGRHVQRTGDLADDEGIDEIHVRQRIEGLLCESEVLLVLRVIEATRQRDAIGDFEIHRSEDRIAFVLKREGFTRKRPLGEAATLRDAQRRFGRRKRAARQGVEERPCRRAIVEAAGLHHVFVEIEAAEQEVERTVEIRRQAQFLREGVDRLVAEFADHVRAGEIDVLLVESAQFAIGSDRGQRKGADLVIGLDRAAIAFDVVGRQLVQIGFVAERIVRRDIAAHRAGRSEGRPGEDVAGEAAILVDLGIIADRADTQRPAIVEEKLRARAVAVAIVDLLVEVDDIDIAVARVVIAFQREGDAVGDRAGDVAAHDDIVVIAVGQRGAAAEGELRLTRDDRDDAGAGILAEQGGLRPAQHFDARDIGEIVDLRRRTRTVDPVDEHADRRLDADIVRAVAEAADEEGGVGRALQLADAQRRRDRLQVEQVADFRAFERLARGDADRDGRFLKSLGTLGGGDDDDVVIGGGGHIGLAIRQVGIVVERRRIFLDRLRGGGAGHEGDRGDTGKQAGRNATRKRTRKIHEKTSLLESDIVGTAFLSDARGKAALAPPPFTWRRHPEQARSRHFDELRSVLRARHTFRYGLARV